MGFSILGYWGPHYKGDPTIWGSVLGVPYYRQPAHLFGHPRHGQQLERGQEASLPNYCAQTVPARLCDVPRTLKPGGLNPKPFRVGGLGVRVHCFDLLFKLRGPDFGTVM